MTLTNARSQVTLINARKTNHLDQTNVNTQTLTNLVNPTSQIVIQKNPTRSQESADTSVMIAATISPLPTNALLPLPPVAAAATLHPRPPPALILHLQTRVTTAARSTENTKNADVVIVITAKVTEADTVIPTRTRTTTMIITMIIIQDAGTTVEVGLTQKRRRAALTSLEEFTASLMSIVGLDLNAMNLLLKNLSLNPSQRVNMKNAESQNASTTRRDAAPRKSVESQRESVITKTEGGDESLLGQIQS
jgi:hypothetical protein